MKPKTAMSRLRAIAQPVALPHLQSREHIVHKVPQEIFDMIFELLSEPDRICFSLSCRHIFACLSSSLKAQDMQLSQLLPPQKRPLLALHAKKWPRNQLLLRLQNERWEFCNDCWILHPRSTWWSTLLSKPYCSQCHLLQEQRWFARSSDEMDICPCLSITFHDKLHLMETCKHPGGLADSKCDHYYDFSNLYQPGSRRLSKTLNHDCTFDDHPFAKVQVLTRVWLEDRTNRLIVRNIYRFDVHDRPSSWRVPTPFICQHRDLGDWLRRFFDEAGSNFSGWDGDHYCSFSCGWTRAAWEKSFGGYWRGWQSYNYERVPASFEMIVERSLGDTTWLDKMRDRKLRRG